MTLAMVQCRVDATVGRVGVEDAMGALVGEVVGHTMGEELEEIVRMRRR